MAMSQAARDIRNKRRRERYARDPEFRKREKERVERYWERQAAAAALEAQEGLPATDSKHHERG